MSFPGDLRTAHGMCLLLSGLSEWHWALDIHVDNDSSSRVFYCVFPLARKHSLTSYDAAYLELAVRSQLPLASLDNDLRSQALYLGIAVLGK